MESTKTDKLLSVVIPAYNVSEYIDKLLNSLLACKRKDQLEILIINDGSKDNTLIKAISYQEQHPNIIKVTDKENGGHGSTINTGKSIASGKYFKVVDGDDWVNTKELDLLIDKLKNTDDDMLVCNYTLMSDDGTIIEQKEEKPEKIKYNVTYSIEEIIEKNVYPFTFHSLFFKTEIFQKSRKIDENCFYVDLEYALYPLEFVKSIRFFCENIYLYRIGRNGQSVSPENYCRNKNNLVTVLLSLSNFVTSYNISLAKREYVIRRIEGLYTTILDIYFFINNKKRANDFLIDIENNVKKMYPEVYKAVGANNELKFLRFFSYHGYNLLYWRRKYITKRFLREY